MADRVILHCDLNCFFASVELLRYPALRDVPVAVCGDPESRHGIVLAKNEAAKQLGVKTAETIWQARQKAPHLITLPPHHSPFPRDLLLTGIRFYLPDGPGPRDLTVRADAHYVDRNERCLLAD